MRRSDSESDFDLCWLILCRNNSGWVCRVFLVCVVVLLAGCERPTAVSLATAENRLLIGNGPEPQALDFHVTTGLAELNIQMALFEGLVSHDPDTLAPIPGVAERWEVSADGLQYDFYLRADARWSDGTAVTAGDFIAGWRRALEPAQAAPYAHMLWPVAGAQAFNQGGGSFAEVGVSSDHDLHVRIILHTPVAHFLSLLQHPVWYPIPAHRLDGGAQAGRSGSRSAGTTDTRIGSWTLPESFVGNGPFKLETWRPNQFIDVVANPYYWDAATVRLAAIRFYAFDEPAAQERAFLAGQLHVTDSLPPNRVAAHQQQADSPLQIDPYLGTYYLLLNHRIAPLNDVRVRRALSLAIDRSAITRNLLRAGQEPAWGFVPTAMPGFTSRIEPAYDPDKARRLLAEAGFAGGAGFPVLEYLFNTSDSHRQIAEAIQAMWQRELGIEVRLANQEWRTYLQRRQQHDFQIARAVWIGDYAQPSTFLNLWRADSPQNWIGWQNAEYDALLLRAATADNADERAAAFADAEYLLIEQQAIVPIYFYVTVYLRRPEVLNWPRNLLHWPSYKFLELVQPF